MNTAGLSSVARRRLLGNLLHANSPGARASPMMLVAYDAGPHSQHQKHHGASASPAASTISVMGPPSFPKYVRGGLVFIRTSPPTCEGFVVPRPSRAGILTRFWGQHQRHHWCQVSCPRGLIKHDALGLTSCFVASPGLCEIFVAQALAPECSGELRASIIKR